MDDERGQNKIKENFPHSRDCFQSYRTVGEHSLNMSAFLQFIFNCSIFLILFSDTQQQTSKQNTLENVSMCETKLKKSCASLGVATIHEFCHWTEICRNILFFIFNLCDREFAISKGNDKQR